MFEHAVSQVPLTLPSHASLFTGLYPPHHAVRDNGGFVLEQDATTLAERFQARRLPDGGVRLVLRAPFPLGHWSGSRDLRRLLRLRRAREPRPYRRRKTRGTGRGCGARLAAAAAARRAPVLPLGSPLRSARPLRAADQYRRRAPTAYAGEVMYADAQVARLLAALDTLGLRRNTLIVYLSDHGESLGEHGEPTHGIFLYGATLDVPLIIAPPPGATLGSPALTLAGRRVGGLARLVDVTPTVLDLVGLPVPSGLDGVSLLPMVAHEGASAAGSPSGRHVGCARRPGVLRGDLLPSVSLQLERAGRAGDGALEVRPRAAARALRPAAGSQATPRRVGRAPARRRHPRQAPRVDEPAEGRRRAHAGAARSRCPCTPAGPWLRRRRRCGPGSPHGPAAGSQRRTSAAAGVAAGAGRPRRRAAR